MKKYSKPRMETATVSVESMIAASVQGMRDPRETYQDEAPERRGEWGDLWSKGSEE